MKKLIGCKMKKLFLGSIIFFTFLLSGVLSAQSTTDINNRLNDKVIANFVMALNSDNPGLKKSALYLVGKYKIEAAVDAVVHILNTDNSGSMKVQAALALYNIGSPIGLNAVVKSDIWNESNFVSEMKTIYSDYELNIEKSLSFK